MEGRTLGWALMLGLMLSGPQALAVPATNERPRVLLEVGLGGPVPGSEGLGYFVPEVSRAIAEGMERGGVVITRAPVGAALPPSAAPASSSAPLTLSVTVEERPSDRVVLVARARGQRLEADGPVETMDLLVDELVARLLPLCIEGVVVPRQPARLSSRSKEAVSSVAPSSSPPPPASPPPAPTPEKTPAASLPAPSPTLIPTPPVGASSAATPASSTPSSSTPSSSTPSSSTPSSSTPATATPASATSTPAATVTPVSTTAQSTSPDPATETKPAPRALKSGEVADPYGPDARVLDTPAGFVRGRVVVHTIVDPTGAEPGTGSIATQALYATLQRRLHLSIVPLGSGLTSLQVAADEGQRAQSRAVVMARLDGYTLYAGTDGPVARMRLELTVVREGRLAMRRLLLAETPPGAINAALAEGRRGRQVDATYLAIVHALDSVLGELTLALAPSSGP